MVYLLQYTNAPRCRALVAERVGLGECHQLLRGRRDLFHGQNIVVLAI